MTPFLKSLQKSKMGLYDSDTNKSLKAYKAVDLTRYCPGEKQVIVKYCKAKRGRIAQITRLYEPEKDLGTQVHYFLNETSAKHLSEDEVFRRFTDGDPFEFAKEIYFHM